MIGKRFASDINHACEQYAKVVNIIKRGRGYRIIFNYNNDTWYILMPLSKFKKRFPHEVSE
jgi:hypothetical protein